MAVNPAGKSATQVIKNAATAPIVFFDGAPVFGHFNGVVEILLTARVLGLKSDNTVSTELAAAAQLRGTAQAFTNLRDACDKALAMIAEQNGGDQKKH